MKKNWDKVKNAEMRDIHLFLNTQNRSHKKQNILNGKQIPDIFKHKRILRLILLKMWKISSCKTLQWFWKILLQLS